MDEETRLLPELQSQHRTYWYLSNAGQLHVSKALSPALRLKERVFQWYWACRGLLRAKTE
jgi:hypothetical protein